MARYVCSYRVNALLEQLPVLLKAIFDVCDFELQYQSVDFMMARERIGRVNYAQLVTLEVFIDRCAGDRENIAVTLVTKNREIPIHSHNYCRQRLQEVQSAIARDSHWKAIADNVA